MSDPAVILCYPLILIFKRRNCAVAAATDPAVTLCILLYYFSIGGVAPSALGLEGFDLFKIKTSAAFDSAHFLSGYNGKCANIHGHRWTVEAVVSGELAETGEKRGMIIDFGDLKKAVRRLADSFDHTLIYETGSLRPTTLAALADEGFSLTEVPFRPTAENLARHFYRLLSSELDGVCSVTVYETPDNCAVYEVER